MSGINTMIKIGADTSGATQNLKKLEQNLENMKKLKDKVNSNGGVASKQEEKELKTLGDDFNSTYDGYITNLKNQAKSLKDELKRVQTEAHNTSNTQLKSSYDAYKKRMEMEKSRIETEIKNLTGLNKAKNGLSNSGEPSTGEEPQKKKFTDSAEFKGFLKSLSSGNGKGMLQSGAGMLGNLMGGKLMTALAPLMKFGAVIAAGVGAYKFADRLAASSNKRDADAVNVWNSAGVYGSDFQQASKDAGRAGANYNYKGDEVLKLQKTLSDVKGYGDNPIEDMTRDTQAIMKASRALGVDPNEMAYNTANMSRQSNMKIPEVTQLITNVTETLGAGGREEEVTEKLQKLIDIGLENNIILNKDQVESYAKMAKVLQDKGYDAGRAMDKAGDLTSKLSGTKSLESYLMSNAKSLGLEGENGLETQSNVRRVLQSKDPEAISKYVSAMLEERGELNTRALLASEGFKEQEIDDAFDVVRKSNSVELTQSNKQAIGGDNYKNSVTGKNDAAATGWDNFKQIGSRLSAWGLSLFNPAIAGSTDIATGNETNKPQYDPSTEIQTQKGSSGGTLNDVIRQSSDKPATPYKPGNLKQKNPEDLDENLMNEIIDRQVEVYEKSSKRQSMLRGQGKAFLDASRQSGINAMDLLSIAMNESAGGTSNIAQKKNNFFGYGAVDNNPYNGANAYATPYDGIVGVARKIGANYVDKRGQVTMEQIGHGFNQFGENTGYKYASDTRWHDKNEKHGEKIYKDYLEIRVSGDLTGVTPEQFNDFKQTTVEYLKLNKFNK